MKTFEDDVTGNEILDGVVTAYEMENLDKFEAAVHDFAFDATISEYSILNIERNVLLLEEGLKSEENNEFQDIFALQIIENPVAVVENSNTIKKDIDGESVMGKMSQ